MFEHTQDTGQKLGAEVVAAEHIILHDIHGSLSVLGKAVAGAYAELLAVHLSPHANSPPLP
jgi:hypothetical protein